MPRGQRSRGQGRIRPTLQSREQSCDWSIVIYNEEMTLVWSLTCWVPPPAGCWLCRLWRGSHRWCLHACDQTSDNIIIIIIRTIIIMMSITIIILYIVMIHGSLRSGKQMDYFNVQIRMASKFKLFKLTSKNCLLTCVVTAGWVLYVPGKVK